FSVPLSRLMPPPAYPELRDRVQPLRFSVPPSCQMPPPPSSLDTVPVPAMLSDTVARVMVAVPETQMAPPCRLAELWDSVLSLTVRVPAPPLIMAPPS